MQKYLVIYLFCILSFLVSVPPQVFAADEVFAILCKEQQTCKQLGNEKIPIFTEKNIVPGQSFSRKLHIKNENKLHTCNLHLRLTETAAAQENKLAPQLQVKLFHDGALILGSELDAHALTIARLQSENFARYFWSVPPKTSVPFDLVITFNPLADNRYQNASAQTDIAVAISCLTEDEFFTVSETPVVLPAPKANTKEVSLQGCTAELSQKVPNLEITNIDTKRDVVSFAWDAVSGAEEYWLEFGYEPNSEQFRHRGITAVKYTLVGLDMTNDSYFRILPVADCARGQYSDAVKVAGKSGQKVVVKEESAVPQVLGSQERVAAESETENLEQETKQQIAKTTTFFWFLILAGLVTSLLALIA